MKREDATDEKTLEDLKLPSRVALLYTDAKREYFETEEAYISDEGADKYAEEIAKYVRNMKIEVELFAGDDKLPENLKKYKPDMALNLVDSVRGDVTLGSSIPGLLEVLHIPYTGAGTLGWSLGCNKFLMYQLMQASGTPVPVHQLMKDASEMINPELRYPLFPKLNWEHSSIGIEANNICQNERELRAKVKDLTTKFKQPVIVDEFISGIEVTAAVLDGMNTKVYAVQRKTGENSVDDVVTFDKKWRNWVEMSYVKYEDPKLKEYVKKAFDLLRMCDYGRIDIRIGAGRYFFIDPNANPFFGPPKETDSTFSIILDMHGVTFEETLKRLFLNTAKDAEHSRNGWSK